MNILSVPRTIGATLATAAEVHSDRIAYIDDGRFYSYRDVDEDADALAARLAAAGVTRGARIAVIIPNQIEWIYLFYAAARLGAVIVGLSVRYRGTELDYMISDSKVSMVVSLAECAGYDYRAYFATARAEGRFPDLRRVVYLAPRSPNALAPFAELAAAPAISPPEGPAADDLMMIIYTSGTTGKPKAAGLTHANMLASAAAECAHLRLAPDDLIQLANPLNHVGGVTCGVLTFLLAGGICELVPSFSAETVLKMAARRPPTAISGVPTMLTLMLQHPKLAEVDFSSVRVVFMGGANVDATLIRRLQQAMPRARLINLYGMSETAGAIVMTPWDCAQEDLLHSIGQPLAGARLRVVGADGREMPAGEVGELWFKGLGVIRGYAGAHDGADILDDEGWLRSGDLGYVDARGFVFLKGRDKDMYIQGGFNVYPVEVEALLATHPAVMLAAGIGVPDPVLGQIGCYYIVPRDGAAVTEQELIAFCREHVADYKVPRQVIIRDRLPTTPAGKIQKAVLRGERLAGHDPSKGA